MWLLYNEAISNESHSHILLVPFLAAFLIYLKKDVIRSIITLEKNKEQVSYFDTLLGSVIIIMALLLYWYGSYKFNFLEYHIISLPILYIGVTVFLFNQEAAKTLIYPMLLLVFLLPPPLETVYDFGGKLANINTYLSYVVLKALRLPVDLSYDYGPPSLILESLKNSQTAFAIDVPCSGIYTLMSFILFASFLIMISKTSAKNKILLFIIGFITFDILNILRIILIISVAHFTNTQIAMSLFHLLAGIILTFIGMIITFTIADRFLNIKFIIDKPNAVCPKCSAYQEENRPFCLNCGNPLNGSKIVLDKIFWGKTAILVIACLIAVLSINVPTLTTATGRVGIDSIKSMENATNILPEIEQYKLMYVYRDTAYEKIADQDASLVYAYHPRRIPSNRSSVFVAVGVADTISNLHSWEVCFITWQTAQGRQPTVEVLDQREIMLHPNTSKAARYLVFMNEDNIIQNTLYWYEKATFSYGITVTQKYVRISLIVIQGNTDTYNEVESELVEIGQKITTFWEPIKRQALISLGIPTLQLSLVALTISAVLIKGTQYTKESSWRNTNQKLFLRTASEEEKRILQSIQKMANTTVQTNDIKDALYENSGKDLPLEEINEYLSSLEKYGFIKMKILDIDNNPKIFWKLY